MKSLRYIQRSILEVPLSHENVTGVCNLETKSETETKDTQNELYTDQGFITQLYHICFLILVWI